MSRTGLNYLLREPEQVVPPASEAVPDIGLHDVNHGPPGHRREINEATELVSSTLSHVRTDNLQHSVAELIGYPVKSQEMLEAVVDTIFSLALQNEGRQSVYAKLVSTDALAEQPWSDKIVRVELLDDKEAPAGAGAYYDVSGGQGEWRGPFESKEAARAEGLRVSCFKRLLLNRCQVEFFNEAAYKDIDAAERADVVAHANRETDLGHALPKDEEDQFKLRALDRAAARKEIKKRTLSNISFIGQLYTTGLLTTQIMHICVVKLLNQGDITNPDADNTEALVKLMTLAGGKLEAVEQAAIAKEVAAAKDKDAVPRTHQRIPLYFELMAKLSKDTKLESRHRYLLQELIALRANKWQRSTTGHSASTASGADAHGGGASISTTAQDCQTGDAVDKAPLSEIDEAVNDAKEVEDKDAGDSDEALGIRRPAAHRSTLSEFDLAAATIPLQLQLRHRQAPRTMAQSHLKVSTVGAVDCATRQPAVVLAELEERLVAESTTAVAAAPRDASSDQVAEAAADAEPASATPSADTGASLSPPVVPPTINDAVDHAEEAAVQRVVDLETGLTASPIPAATLTTPLENDADWLQLQSMLQLRDVNASSISWADFGSFASLTGNRTSAAAGLPASSLAMPFLSTALDPPESAPAAVTAALQSELAATRLENVALRQELVSVRTGVASLNSTVEALTVQVSALAGLLHKVLDAKKELQLRFTL